jgi:hypothetical protein
LVEDGVRVESMRLTALLVGLGIMAACVASPVMADGIPATVVEDFTAQVTGPVVGFNASPGSTFSGELTYQEVNSPWIPNATLVESIGGLQYTGIGFFRAYEVTDGTLQAFGTFTFSDFTEGLWLTFSGSYPLSACGTMGHPGYCGYWPDNTTYLTGTPIQVRDNDGLIGPVSLTPDLGAQRWFNATVTSISDPTSAVPEPWTLGLVAGGLLTLIGVRRWRG